VLRYPVMVTKEGKNLLAEFPDCPGCQTFARPGTEIASESRDALVGWLEATLQEGDLPPKPSTKAGAVPQGAEVLWVEVPAKLGVKLEMRWARAAAGLTQAELARRAGVSQPAIAQIEHPDSNPTIDTLQKVADALGVKLSVSLVP